MLYRWIEDPNSLSFGFLLFPNPFESPGLWRKVTVTLHLVVLTPLANRLCFIAFEMSESAESNLSILYDKYSNQLDLLAVVYLGQ